LILYTIGVTLIFKFHGAKPFFENPVDTLVVEKRYSFYVTRSIFANFTTVPHFNIILISDYTLQHILDD